MITAIQSGDVHTRGALLFFPASFAFLSPKPFMPEITSTVIPAGSDTSLTIRFITIPADANQFSPLILPPIIFSSIPLSL